MNNNFLSTLIQTGADASLNLFIADIRLINKNTQDRNSKETDSDISFRVISAPSLVVRDSSTVSLPYQNISIDRLSTGTSITKIQSLSVRLDNNYLLLDKIRNLQCIDIDGNFYRDSSKEFDVIITAISPLNNEFKDVYEWKFNNCYITTISPLSYDYDSASSASFNISFVWGTYKEGIPDADGSSLLHRELIV